MELVVGVLVVPALIAVVARFVLRGDGGPVQLPRIVDESIGMYVLRGITGRPLGRTPDPPPPDAFARYRRPSTVLAPRVDPRMSLARWPVQPAVAAVGPGIVAAAPSDPRWSVVPRLAVAGQAFGGSAFATLEGEPYLTRLRLALRPSWLAGAIVVGLLAGGGLALITR
jgi:hypothetical protein